MIHWFKHIVPEHFYPHRKLFLLSLGLMILSSVTGFTGSLVSTQAETLFLRVGLIDWKGNIDRNEDYIALTERNIKMGKPFRIYQEEDKGSMFAGVMLNNTGIVLLIFFGGMLAGSLTVYFLVMTGLMVGAFAHIFYRHEIIFDFWNTFLLHGLIELAMLVVAGMAGLLLTKGLINSFKSRDLSGFGAVFPSALHLLGLAMIGMCIAGLMEVFVTGSNLLSLAKSAINLTSLVGLVWFFCQRPALSIPNDENGTS